MGFLNQQKLHGWIKARKVKKVLAALLHFVKEGYV